MELRIISYYSRKLLKLQLVGKIANDTAYPPSLHINLLIMFLSCVLYTERRITHSFLEIFSLVSKKQLCLLLFQSKKKTMDHALFNYRFTIQTHGYQKTRLHFYVILKVHNIEIFFGFDFEICIISLLVMSKY